MKKPPGLPGGFVFLIFGLLNYSLMVLVKLYSFQLAVGVNGVLCVVCVGVYF
jgi:hypothetical protein